MMSLTEHFCLMKNNAEALMRVYLITAIATVSFSLFCCKESFAQSGGYRSPRLGGGYNYYGSNGQS
jgi:hypothetical protein